MLEEFWNWLRLETPARVDELVARVEVLHRMLPKSYAGWPKDAAEVSDALRALEIQGRVERVGSDWRWVGKVAVEKREPQRELFA